MTDPRPFHRHMPSELLLVGLLALWSLPFIWTITFPPDEFTTLSNGARQAAGQVLYRDFFEFTAPVSHWLAGLTVWLAGPSVVAVRAVQALLLVIAGWQCHAVARRLGLGPWLAMVPALLLLMVFYRMYPGFSHHWVTMPFLLAAVLAAFRGHEGGGAWWVGAGAATGLTFLTMQSDGAVLGLVLALWVAMLAVFGRSGWGEAAVRVGAIALGACLPLALAAGYFLANGALGAAWYHVWVWSTENYKQSGGVNDIKYMTDLATYVTTSTRAWVNMPFWYAKVFHVIGILALLPAAAAYALAWGLGRLWARVAHREALCDVDARLGLVALLAVAFFALATRGRADLPHAVFYALPAGLVASVVAHRVRAAMGDPAQVLTRQLPLALLVGLIGTGVVFQAVGATRSPELWLNPESPERRLAAAPIFRFLSAHTGPGDRVISIPSGGLHYFLGPAPASRFTLILPPESGYNSQAEYEAFWDELRKERPKYVLVAPFFGAMLARLDAMPGYRRLPQALESPTGTGGLAKTVLYERTD